MPAPAMPSPFHNLARVAATLGKWRVLFPMGLAVLISACSSAPGEEAAGRIMLVDGLGAPVQGAVVLPEEEELSGNVPRVWSRADNLDRTSDSRGIVRADLQQYFWDSDSCYHFRIQRTGFEDVTMSVSKELFPPVLRINLEAGPERTKPSSSASPTAAAQPPRQP